MKNTVLEKRGTVALLTMNYKQENRLHPDFVEELLLRLDEVEHDDEMRALVVTGGDSKYFCNGLDLEWFAANRDRLGLAVTECMTRVNRLYSRLTVFPKPTVAASNGHVFAGGVFLACTMDFRFMREERGWVCLPEVDIKIPLLPGMMAITQAVVTPQGFRELYFTGRRFTAKEAQAIGFADRVVPGENLIAEALDFAATLAAKPTPVYAEMKRRLRSPIVEIFERVDPDYFAQALTFALQG